MNTYKPKRVCLRHWRSVGLLNLVIVLASCSPEPPTPPGPRLAWAYPTAAASYFEMPASPAPFRVPGSSLTFSEKQVEDDDNPVDWFPTEHPPPPFAVAHKRSNGATPCAECHLYNGHGFLGAPDLDALTSRYIIEQVKGVSERRTTISPA